jgi:hypothetical protein
MAMARHALADDGAVEDIERREQGGRAVADVIMGSSFRPGPSWLGAVECLDLALLVDREHEAVCLGLPPTIADASRALGHARSLTSCSSFKRTHVRFR